QESINNLDIEQLQSRLRHRLSCQKYLLVLDDVWNNNRAKWIELKDLIKVGAVGSKILVTTRSTSIASMMGTVPSYVLEGLSVENCLSLFLKWAFREGEEKEHPYLVDIGKEIVKKCRGVPLALKTSGSSLFSIFDLERWKILRDHELWNRKQQKDDILPSLKLSYDQMPSYLRHCFALFSLYPKDFGFTCAEIANFWATLGLLRSPFGSQKIENVGKLYINELYSRSFLEDFGTVYYFKLHDLVHDLSLYVAKEEFLMVNSHTRSIPEQVRDISVVENDSLRHTVFPKSRGVRTIIFPVDGVGVGSESLLETWIKRYKYLRHLNLSNSSFATLPNSIAKLEHLRALILDKKFKIKRLPNSICRLQNLQKLSLRRCLGLETLPKRLGMLISLRKLYITTKQSILSEDEFASLNHLHTLVFEYCDNLKFLFRGAQTQLPSLEVLIIQSCGKLECLPFHILPKIEVLIVTRCLMLILSLNSEIPIQR
ncbi:putative disease resistance protein RGA3, partial [Vigna umbellata]|uniref:putative disease resistance protein RGA3 n=1 Tax=Vigna umbellata TaxID=87088 RepID=UPI001F5E4D68